LRHLLALFKLELQEFSLLELLLSFIPALLLVLGKTVEVVRNVVQHDHLKGRGQEDVGDLA